MVIFETLAPIILLIALGAGLARVAFLGRDFMGDLNRLVFWVGLPAFIFRSLAEAQAPGERTLVLIAILAAATLAAAAMAAVASRVAGVRKEVIGTVMQGGFRGNLAYIGLPVLFYSMSSLAPEIKEAAYATALLVMAPVAALYNVLAVVVLQERFVMNARELRRLAMGIATNPLIAASVAGVVAAWVDLPIPRFVDEALRSLGAIAVPVALLCIGGALMDAAVRGVRTPIAIGVAVKVVATPVIVFAFCAVAGVTGLDLRIALVLAACPTAAASFIMARQMGGDEAVASGIIAASTVVSAVSLACALWVGRG